MFTGLIEEIGLVVSVTDGEDFRSIRVRADRVMEDLHLGSSIAVNGVCLTVRAIEKAAFTADVVHETLKRTTLGHLDEGSIVNLERPMRADSRFGGHIVQGHVDSVGRILQFEQNGDNRTLTVEIPASAARYIVEKGSITIDGISLTVASLSVDAFCVAIIPHTLENTNLKAARTGDLVNLELDIIAKYVERLRHVGD